MKRQSAEDDALGALAEALKPIAVAMLKGNLSASALVQAAKLAYIRAAVDRLNSEGRRTNISRLSVITGMTRKEIAAYLRRRAAAFDGHAKKQMEHRALRVLRAWTTDPRYKLASGKVIDLPPDGAGKTFASLVRAHGGDVTAVSVLREMERLRAVTRSRAGLLRVRPAGVQAQLRAPARLREFSRLIADFSSTAAQVLINNERPLYFGFKDLEVESESQAERFKASFGRRASLLLDSVEHWHSRQIGRERPARKKPQRLSSRIGLGIYLAESRIPSESSSRRGR